ncbi:hypothetical protein 7S2_39 [uncultured Caudovirales phage]|uniref:DNA-damage-inducible protein D n=1 Tax=uncultured Caudovirales phage TaxID=2100421 RepID=A0A2H4J9U6_9CAUD|nr:hypothetical protein 7S2_39 [uncultured Caudovirales phage]
MSDTTGLATITTGSPFDEIRRVRPDGTEFWSARELQPFMGYSKWQDFQNAIERAKAAAANAGHDAGTLFTQVNQLMDAGNLGPQQRIDYELPRFACYLTFLNGDPRKPEVAAAQAYFAIRTREAETQPAKPANQFDILRAAIDQIEVAQREASEAKQIAERSEARLDAIEGRHDWFSALGYARLQRIPNTSSKFLQRVGSHATSVAKARGISPVKVPHQLFGEVNSYPAWIWEIAFEGFKEGDVA